MRRLPASLFVIGDSDPPEAFAAVPTALGTHSKAKKQSAKGQDVHVLAPNRPVSLQVEAGRVRYRAWMLPAFATRVVVAARAITIAVAVTAWAVAARALSRFV